ncbi:MAG: glycosyl hydrolase 108 family protein [Pseudomonadota bacterium]
MPSEAHADFEKAYAALEQFEGGYANNSYDKGGETYKGISRKFWPNWQGWPIIDAAKVHSSFAESARAFSKHLAQIDGLNDLVKQYYFDVWWAPLQFCALPSDIIAELFEQSVNLGRSSSCRYLQKMCNAMNYIDGERIFEKDLVEDGALGPKTMLAFADVVAYRSNDEILHVLNVLQAHHYINVASSERNQRQHLSGWLKRTH